MDRTHYLTLIEPAIALVARKSEDYQSAAVALEDYFPFGDKSYVQMLHVKTMRLVSLANNSNPNFEAAQDSVLDLINYAVFYLEYFQRRHHEL